MKIPERCPQSYYDKADEIEAFKDYAQFRYGIVPRDAVHDAHLTALRRELDPILVDIVDGGMEAAVVEAEAAV